MLPKPSFVHTVSAVPRFFESAFEKMISSRDRLQKLGNLPLFQRFYSNPFLVQESFFLEKKFVQAYKMDDIGPRGSSKLLWQPPRAFFSVRMSNKHGFCRADRVLAASWRLPGCHWRPLAPPGCLLRLPGSPWRPLAAACVDSFWRPWALLGLLGGSLCSLLFLAGLGVFFIVLAGVQISTIFSRSLSSKVFLN